MYAIRSYYGKNAFNNTEVHYTNISPGKYQFKVKAKTAAGIKAQWLQQRIYTNLAFFYIDWNNQQIYQTVPSGTGSMLTNAGKSESKGVEFEFDALNLIRITSYNVCYTKLLRRIIILWDS